MFFPRTVPYSELCDMVLKNATIQEDRSEQWKKETCVCFVPLSRTPEGLADPLPGVFQESRAVRAGASNLPTGLFNLVLQEVNWDTRRRWEATVGWWEPGLELAAPCGRRALLIASDWRGGSWALLLVALVISLEPWSKGGQGAPQLLLPLTAACELPCFPSTASPPGLGRWP